MHNAPYQRLKERLAKSLVQPFASNDAQQLYDTVFDHMDALVCDASLVDSIGHLFVSRFVQECPRLDQVCLSELQTLGQEAFNWSIEHEAWRTAAWLVLLSGLRIPLPAPLHPHPKLLHALICNDGTNWPTLYVESLKDAELMKHVFAYEKVFSTDDAHTLTTFHKYTNQLSHACYLGPGQGLLAFSAVIRWSMTQSSMQLPFNKNAFPEMTLAHRHPDSMELTQLLQNHVCFERFWHTGCKQHLDHLIGLDIEAFQSWYWLLCVRSCAPFPKIGTMDIWTIWWDNHFKSVVENSMHWLNLHLLINDLDLSVLSSDECLLAVKSALALESRQCDEHYELPEEYP